MSKSQSNQTARLIREHYRASRKAMQKHITALYLLYRTFDELERQMGKEGFKQWMTVHCPEIPWSDVELVIEQVKDMPITKQINAITNASSN